MRAVFIAALFLPSFSLASFALAECEYVSPISDFYGEQGTELGQLSNPTGVGLGSSGAYIADTGNDRVVVFNYGEWRELESGPGGFLSPTDIAVSFDGTVFVVDSGNHRIQVFDSSERHLLSWGTFGVEDGEFDSPMYISIMLATGDVFVTDRGNQRVQRFSKSGDHILSWGGYGSGNDEFLDPTGISAGFEAGVYVADAGLGSIRHFSKTGEYLDTIVTGLTAPMGIMSRDCFFIADPEANRILTPHGGTIVEGEYSDISRIECCYYAVAVDRGNHRVNVFWGADANKAVTWGHLKAIYK